jgi:hypothetical protein
MLLLLVASSLFAASPAAARLDNVVTQWINATQYVVATTGAHNVSSSRWYALTAFAIHNAVVTGECKPSGPEMFLRAVHAL